MLGVAGPSAITTHYNTHLIDALDSAHRLGYSEVRSEVGGNALLSVRLPWLCIFCVHNHALPMDQRLSPANQVVGDSTSKSRVKHLKAHFDDIEGRAYCPASAASGAESPLCTLSIELNTEELAGHLIKVHGIFDVQHMLNSIECRKAAKKGGKMMHEDTPEEAPDVPEPQSFEVLKERSANIPVRNTSSESSSKSTKRVSGR
jgi:hypothetical protein